MPTLLDSTLNTIPGLTHFWDLTVDAKDKVGTQHGTATGVKFANGRAVFDGTASINFGDHPDFSITTTGALTILCFVTIDDWHGKGGSEYIHWAGKGRPGDHEYAFRHYVKDGTGEAAARTGRMSGYVFNANGGQGAGSYVQDSTLPTGERLWVWSSDRTRCSASINGGQTQNKDFDTDLLSGYNITPTDEPSEFMVGTRGDGTFLVGKLSGIATFNRVLTATERTKVYAARALDRAPKDPLLASSAADIIAAHNALVAKLRTNGVI